MLPTALLKLNLCRLEMPFALRLGRLCFVCATIDSNCVTIHSKDGTVSPSNVYSIILLELFCPGNLAVQIVCVVLLIAVRFAVS